MRAAALDQIRDFADTGDGPLGLLARADEAVIRALPADQSSWQVYDPDAMLPVGFYATQPAPFEERLVHCKIEQGGADFNLFRDLARRSVPVATLDAATHGNPHHSRRYQELLRPAGFRHEVRAALVHRGTCWGALTLVRSGSKGFTATELRWLATVSHVVAADLSRRMAVRADDSATPGPGVLLLWPGGEQVSLNPQAGYWLDALSKPPWGADRARAALQGGVIRAIGQRQSRQVRLHLPTQVGWAAAHVSVTAQSDCATVVIDLARPSQVIPLLAAAYGLTTTEQAVTSLILRGMSAKQAARQLRVSSGTINDHLKSIYAKTGTSSRGQLQHLLALDPAGRLGGGERGRALRRHRAGAGARHRRAGQAGDLPGPGARRGETDDEPARSFTCKAPMAAEHHTTIREAGDGVQAVCTCGWRSPVFGADKTAGTMDPLQRAAEAGDPHEWEMSLQLAAPHARGNVRGHARRGGSRRSPTVAAAVDRDGSLIVSRRSR